MNVNDSYNDDEDSDSDNDLDSEEDNKKLFGSNFATQLAEDLKNKEKKEEDNCIINTSSSPNKENIENELNRSKSSISDISTELINSAAKEAEETLKNKEIKLSKIFRTKNRKN